MGVTESSTHFCDRPCVRGSARLHLPSPPHSWARIWPFACSPVTAGSESHISVSVPSSASLCMYYSWSYQRRHGYLSGQSPETGHKRCQPAHLLKGQQGGEEPGLCSQARGLWGLGLLHPNCQIQGIWPELLEPRFFIFKVRIINMPFQQWKLNSTHKVLKMVVILWHTKN